VYEALEDLGAHVTLAELNLQPDQVRALYLVHLLQMYSATEQMLYAMPTIAVGISETKIKQRLLDNALGIPHRIALLKGIFSELDETPTGPVCMPVKALVDLGEELLSHPDGAGRDLLLTAVALEMTQLDIAKYSMAMIFAQALDFPQQVLALSDVMQRASNFSRDLTLLLRKMQIITATS